MTRGEHLKHAISFALIGASTIVRGMWRTLTDAERSAVASRTVNKLREHGDRWKLDEEMQASTEAHRTPRNFTEAHQHKKDS
jgi:hypothetical protein